MPTYEYECDHCGHTFERFQSMKDEPVKRCPECRHKVRRLLSGGAGLIFKGDGFYSTDYRSDNYKKRAKEESQKEKKSSSSGESTGKKETKGKDSKKGGEKKKDSK